MDVPKIVVELAVSSGEAGSSVPGERDTTDAAATVVEEPVGEARPLGIAQYSAATASALAVSSGETGSVRPGDKDTTDADGTAVVGPAGEDRPCGIAKQSATTESDIAVSLW